MKGNSAAVVETRLKQSAHFLKLVVTANQFWKMLKMWNLLRYLDFYFSSSSVRKEIVKLPNFQAKVVLFVGHFLLPGQKFLRQRTMQSYIYGRRRRSEKKIFMLMMTASSSRSLILLPLKIQGTLFFAIHQFVCFNNVTKNIEHEVLLWYIPFLETCNIQPI